jgi:predicted RNase H-like HicB family nuclease
MKMGDRYHKWIEWSEEDAAYLGKCPDLMTGIHGDDPVKLYAELYEVVEDVICHFEAEGRPLPSPRVRPMQVGRQELKRDKT